MKPFYFFALLSILPGLAFAQASGDSTNTDNPPPPPQGEWHHHGFDPAKELEHLTKALDLSTTQQNEIQPLLQKLAATLKTIHDNTSLTEDQKHDQVKQAFEDTNTEIEGLLTSDQDAAFIRMQKHHGPPPPPQ